MTDIYLRTGLALTLVIGTIIFFSALMKKRQEKVALIKVMSYQSLGQKKGIAMVQAGQEVLLVAVTATDIKLLKSLNHAPDAERVHVQEEIIKAPDMASKMEVMQFGDEFEKQLTREKAGGIMMANTAVDNSNLGKLKSLKDRLLCN